MIFRNIFSADLCTSPWKLLDATTGEDFGAVCLPGSVHAMLAQLGRIPAPWTPGAESASAWVAEHDWGLSTDFPVAPESLSLTRVELVLESVDCLATLWINGQHLMDLANAFRSWRIPVRSQLRPGTNRLEIHLASPLRAIADRSARSSVRDVIEVQSFISRHAWLRKTACGFGWDWGPAFPSVAVGRVVLECRNAPRIRSVRVVQHHDPGGDVTLELQPEVEPGVPDPGWRVTVSQDGAECARADRLSLRLPRPRLWWPNGMGSQPLYDILVELLDDQGGAVATVSKRIGLRTVSLLQEPDPNGLGRGFSFRVNGRPSFAKGANWIPPDLFSWESAPDTTRTILKGAAAAKMNMVRVWGGGRYETDTFYDTCDELGLLVWQDFMFACGSYPAWDEAWLGNVAIEADDPVRRLAHHACLALWCGNNEIEHNFVGDRWAHEKRLWTDKVMGRAD